MRVFVLRVELRGQSDTRIRDRRYLAGSRFSLRQEHFGAQQVCLRGNGLLFRHGGNRLRRRLEDVRVGFHSQHGLGHADQAVATRAASEFVRAPEPAERLQVFATPKQTLALFALIAAARGRSRSLHAAGRASGTIVRSASKRSRPGMRSSHTRLQSVSRELSSTVSSDQRSISCASSATNQVKMPTLTSIGNSSRDGVGAVQREGRRSSCAESYVIMGDVVGRPRSRARAGRDSNRIVDYDRSGSTEKGGARWNRSPSTGGLGPRPSCAWRQVHFGIGPLVSGSRFEVRGSGSRFHRAVDPGPRSRRRDQDHGPRDLRTSSRERSGDRSRSSRRRSHARSSGPRSSRSPFSLHRSASPSDPLCRPRSADLTCPGRPAASTSP